MQFQTRTDEDGRIVLQLGLTHEAGFPPEPDMNVIVNGVQLLVEAVCGISIFDLTRAVIEEYVKNGTPPEGWEAPSNDNAEEKEPEECESSSAEAEPSPTLG